MAVLTWWERGVRVLIALVVALATGGLLLGFFGVYHPLSVVVVVGALTVGIDRVWASISPELVDPDDDGWAWIVGIVGIAACVVVHGWFAGEFFFISRDPAFYNLVGLDLARTGDLTLDGVSATLAQVPGVELRAQGIARGPNDAEMYVQGFHGLAAVNAPFEWLGGLEVYLRATAVLGGVCLLALRRVAVRVASPWAATFVTGALGASTPFVEFTRNPYSEILVLVTVLGALLVLLEGPIGPRRLLLASFIAGAAATARIDSLLVISGVVAAAVLYPLVVESRAIRWIELAAVVVGTGTAAGVGLTIGYARSPVYVDDLSDRMALQLLVVAAVAGAIVSAYLLWFVAGLRSVDRSSTASTRVAASAAGVVVAGGVLYWYVAPRVFTTHRRPGREVVAALQRAEGVAVDATHTYGEASLVRLGLTYGSVLVALGLAGAGIMVYRLLRTRSQPAWLLVMVGAPSLPYLVDARIVADMPWAMRRFLPVIIPLLLLLAAVALDALRAWAARRWTSETGARVFWGVGLVGVAWTVALVAPVVRIGGERGSLALIDDVCEAMPEDTSAAFATQGWLRLVGLQTVDTFCGVDTVRSLDSAGDDTVGRAVVDALGDQGPVVFLTAEDEALPPGITETSRTTVVGALEFVGQSIERPPLTRGVNHQTIDVVVVTAPGQGDGAGESTDS